MSHPDAILARLLRLHPKLIDLSLGRIERLLAGLGDPHRHLPPVIHVAGTNGKGSTVAFLRAMLEAAGKTVHTYTSPHLVRFNERISVAGRDVDDEALSALLLECEEANRGEPITFFEITTAAALLAFARTPADVALLEVGLGGRLDATNVVERPAVCAITPIGLDHQQYLGDTLTLIGGEKAGILKAGVPAVIAPQPPEAARAIDARADAIGAPLHRAGREWRVAPAGDGFEYAGSRWRLQLPLPALPGRHQIDNAGTAIACLERFEPGIVSPEAIREGLGTVRWPARLQRLGSGPLQALLSSGSELWLDGGHNAAAGAVLAAMARGWSDLPLHLVVGMLDTKDAAGFLAPLAPHARSLRAVPIPGAEAGLSAEALARAARSVGLDASEAPTVADAIAAIVAEAGKPVRILICGSLYLAGAVLASDG